MELTLVRTNLGDVCTLGELYVNHTFECYTLELPVKDGLPGSAIPPGKYLIKLLPSPKFELAASAEPPTDYSRWVKQYADAIPHILGVDTQYNRSGILIHWLNTVSETEGCVGVGQTQSENFIGNSRAAFTALWEKLSNVNPGEIISIEVQGGQTLNNRGAVQDALEGS